MLKCSFLNAEGDCGETKTRGENSNVAPEVVVRSLVPRYGLCEGRPQRQIKDTRRQTKTE